MLRSTLIAALAGLVLAVPASGAPLGVYDDPAATGVALAGPDVIVQRHTRAGLAQVLAVPRAGGPARTLLSVRPGYETLERWGLAASAARVGAIVVRENANGNELEWRVYSGPPAGPLQLVQRTPNRGPDTWIPVRVDVDGDRLLLLEFTDDGSNRIRARTLDSASGFVPVPWARPSLVPIAIAGEFAAVAAAGPRRLAVTELATGAERATLTVDWSAPDLDVGADGRIVAATETGILAARPGEPARALPGTRGFTQPRVAGDAVAAVDGEVVGQNLAGVGTPMLLRADGSRAALGAVSHLLVDLAADVTGAAWVANGCVRYAAIAGPPVTAAAPDPCPSAEVSLYAIAASKLRGRFVQTPVRCIAAATPTCRGTVVARLGGRIVGTGRFSVPAGKQGEVRIRLTAGVAARFRREDGGGLVIGARVVDGRVGVGRGYSELSVDA